MRCELRASLAAVARAPESGDELLERVVAMLARLAGA